MLISHTHKFVFIHVPKAAGHSISAALYPYMHIDFKLQGWKRHFYPWLFKSVNKVTNNKEVGLLRWNLLLKAIDDLEYGKEIPKLHFLGQSEGIVIYDQLMRSYLNAGFPEIYSTVLNHDTMMEVRESDVKGKLNEYFKFGFARHPADWLVSIFFFLRQRPQLKILHERVLQFEDFQEFVEYLFQFRSEGKSNNVLAELPFRTQSDYLFDDSDQCIVDKIGRLEFFEEEFTSIMQTIGIDRTLQHGNKSKHNSFLSYYDEPLWEKACFIMERDFRLLSYEKSFDIMRQEPASVN